jgi:hypothetical protein
MIEYNKIIIGRLQMKKTYIVPSVTKADEGESAGVIAQASGAIVIIVIAVAINAVVPTP